VQCVPANPSHAAFVQTDHVKYSGYLAACVTEITVSHQDELPMLAGVRRMAQDAKWMSPPASSLSDDQQAPYIAALPGGGALGLSSPQGNLPNEEANHSYTASSEAVEAIALSEPEDALNFTKLNSIEEADYNTLLVATSPQGNKVHKGGMLPASQWCALNPSCL
jgi:hypothetical protein